MTEPQVWTMIGVFAALMFGMLTIVSTLFVRVIRSEIGGLRSEIAGLRAEMNARFEIVDQKLAYLDRNVQLLMNREFGSDRG